MKQTNKPQLLESVEQVSEQALGALVVTGMFVFFTLVVSIVVFAAAWQ